MPYFDHLQGANPENLVLEVCAGIHVITGDLAKSVSDGTNVYVQQMLGEAFGRGWRGISRGAYFDGERITDTAIRFYPGKMSASNTDTVQGIDPAFPLDTAHSNTCYAVFPVPPSLAATYQDNQKNPPDKARFIVETQIGDIYDDAGNLTTADVYLTDAADFAVFLCKQVRGYDNARINWTSFAAFRAYNQTLFTPDYTALPTGIGISANYYSGANFDTLVISRIDPVIEFDSSAGSPSFSIPVDGFSARYEGKIKARYSETYTFSLTHQDGGRLYIGGTLLIDYFPGTAGAVRTDTVTIALTAAAFYDIKVEWNNISGDAEIRLAWSSASQVSEVVPQERLYPKAVPQKNYLCNIATTEATDLDTALNVVLRQSNAFYQEADGQISFYSFDTLTPTFHFDADNIVPGTFKTRLRYSQTELRNLPTRWKADGRDTDSQYLEPFAPEVYFDTPVLQQTDLGHINVQSVTVGNCDRIQALKIVTLEAKLKGQGAICNFEATAVSYPVLPYDVVTLTWEAKGWTNKTFIILEATDKSIDAGADERIFQLFEWAIVTPESTEPEFEVNLQNYGG